MHAGTAGGYRSITRRLFFIFITFALIPVVALSVVAVRYISSTSQEQMERMLTSEVDAFADITHGRLSLASRRLELYTESQAAVVMARRGRAARRRRVVRTSTVVTVRDSSKSSALTAPSSGSDSDVSRG